jgi:hypothetical protein
MALIMAVLAGIAAALVVHAVSWYARLQSLPLAVGLGVITAMLFVSASAIFLVLFIIYPSSGADGAYVVQYLFAAIWGFVVLFALLFGILQARSLPAPWWQGVLSACFEAGLGFLVLVGANYTLQWLAPLFERLFHETIDLFRNRFILVFTMTLLALAVLRPVIRMNREEWGSNPTVRREFAAGLTRDASGERLPLP